MMITELKKVYVSEIVCPRRRGRPVVRWKDRVKEYMHERVGGRGKNFLGMVILLGNISRGNNTSEAIDSNVGCFHLEVDEWLE